jgi:glycosyltransferase involved in cell wall biosynthesis
MNQSERHHEPPVVLYLDHTAKWSGGEIALLRTLEAIDRTRVTPVVALASEGPFADRLREAKIETHILPLAENLREVRKGSLGGGAVFSKIGAAAAYAGYARTVAAYARKRGAAIIHCNSLKSDIYGALAGQIARVPVIWHVRDHIDPSYLPGPAVRGFRALARLWPAFVITNSESTREKLFFDGPGKVACRSIHDGLGDHELTSPPPPVGAGWKNAPPRVGIVGRLVEWKGQHVFLEAARKVVEGGRDARFVLIGGALFGENDFEERLKETARPLGDRVEFLGFRTDVPELLRGLDVCVHASTTPEPFGQVVIEAMAEGLPVIASDGGGVREIIENGETGLLTPMKDADALAAAIRSLLDDPARANRLARAGHARVRAEFTAAKNARRIEAVYDEILAKTRRGAARPASEARPHGEKV